MTEATPLRAGALSPALKKGAFIAAKLLVLYIYFELYASYLSPEITPELTFRRYYLETVRVMLVMVLLHFAVQTVFMIGTTPCTRKFVVWQVAAFTGIIFIRMICLMQCFTPEGFFWLDYRIFAAKMLPIFLVVHGLLHLIFITVVGWWHRKRHPA